MTVMPALVVETKPILYEGDSCPWCEEVIEFTSEESEIKKLRGENDYLKKMNYALSLDLDNTVVENPNNKERE